MSRSKQKYIHFDFRGRTITLLLDKVLLFRFFQNLHGRFWGIASLIIFGTGISLCFAIRPDLRSASTAFSDFGNDIRTAPYFAGALFFSSYGLWRWRNYIVRTVDRNWPMNLLLTITILSLYIIALMPIAWGPLPHKIHIAGVVLLGCSTALTVVFDSLFSKTRKGKNVNLWRLLRFTSFWLIIVGGFITLGSSEQVNWFALSGPGELLMLAGYAVWIIEKTYHGDGGRTTLSKMVSDFIKIEG